MKFKTAQFSLIVLLDNVALAQRPAFKIIQLYNIPREAVAPSVKGIWWKTPINILTITDTRVGGKNTIGENIHNEQTVPIYTKTNVPGFTLSAFKTYFKNYGGKNETESRLELSLELLRFFVIESENYIGEVKIKYTLSDKQGNPIWYGIKTGRSDVFGSSLKDVNYNEALSDAMQNSFFKLLEDDGFTEAYSGKYFAIVPVQKSGTNIHSLKIQAVKLIKGGFDESTLLVYVKQHAVSSELIPKKMIEWYNEGTPRSVATEVIKLNY